MKKIFLITIALIISSCSETEDKTLIYDSRNFSNPKETEFVTISKLNSNKTNESLEYNFSWTDVTINEIKNKDKNYNTIIFRKDNKSLETNVFVETLANGNRNVRFTNNSGNFLFSFTLDNNSIYTNFEVGDFMSELQENFSVTNFTNNSTSRLPGGHEYDPMEDCGKYNFEECMKCGNDVCDQDWRCDLARTAAGPAWVAGLAITCGLRQVL